MASLPLSLLCVPKPCFRDVHKYNQTLNLNIFDKEIDYIRASNADPVIQLSGLLHRRGVYFTIDVDFVFLIYS